MSDDCCTLFYPIAKVMIVTSSWMVLATTAHLQTIYMRQGLGTTFDLVISLMISGPIAFSASGQMLALALELLGLIRIDTSDVISILLLLVEFVGLAPAVFFFGLWVDLPKSSYRKVGGCIPHTGDQIQDAWNDRLCQEWKLRLAFGVLLLVSIGLDGLGWGCRDGFRRWIKGIKQRRVARRQAPPSQLQPVSSSLALPLYQPPAPLPPAYIPPPAGGADLTIPAQDTVYDVPAAGPNKASKDLKQAS